MNCRDMNDNKVKCEHSYQLQDEHDPCDECKIITPTFDFFVRKLAENDDMPSNIWRERMVQCAKDHIDIMQSYSNPGCLISSYLEWRVNH